MAKLDVDKDEGEDGKEEHHVSHLSEQYSLNMEIYANYFPPKSNIIFRLEKRKSIASTLMRLSIRLLDERVPTTEGGDLSSKSFSC